MKKFVKSIRFFTFAACLLVVASMLFFNHQVNREKKMEVETLPKTEVEKLIAKDLEQGYPETPKEVVLLYCRINQCIYNGKLDDENLKKILEQMRVLFSQELLAQNPLEHHMQSLKSELELYAEKKRTIVSYTVGKSSVEYKKIKGQECATVDVAYFLGESSGYAKTYESMLLRKEDKKWKIVGYEQITGDAKEEIKKDE